MLQKIQKQSVTFGWVEFWVMPKLYMAQCITVNGCFIDIIMQCDV